MSVLGPELEDATVVDLFAGSGALGLEALSRGARHATLVERGRRVVECLRANVAALEAEARARKWAFATRTELLRLPEVRALYQAEIDRLNASLASFETVKRFALLDQELTQENGELTPTFKVKRRVINQKYAQLIEGLYARHPKTAAP